MNSIDLMVKEHEYITRMLKVIRKASYNVLKGEDISYSDYEKIIDFVRGYADNHHHGKEEKILFNRMVEEMGDLGDKVINHGMLVEHDLGRFYIRSLEEALLRVKSGDEESRLDVISNAIAYEKLLTGHIDKENNAIYKTAIRELSKDVLDEVEVNCNEFEDSQTEKGIQDKYIKLLEKLESKYL